MPVSLAVVIPYSTTTTTSSSSFSISSNPHTWSILKRRGSMGGILSTPLPQTTSTGQGGLMILGRRRTVFGGMMNIGGSAGWWCPESLVSACESVSEGELQLPLYAMLGDLPAVCTSPSTVQSCSSFGAKGIPPLCSGCTRYSIAGAFLSNSLVGRCTMS